MEIIGRRTRDSTWKINTLESLELKIGDLIEIIYCFNFTSCTFNNNKFTQIFSLIIKQYLNYRCQYSLRILRHFTRNQSRVGLTKETP